MPDTTTIYITSTATGTAVATITEAESFNIESAELGTDGQKHELSAKESRRAELGLDEQMNKDSNLHELE
ncbi:hypothetical protein N7454_005237 [Penicillium verhagenii]|nr:hypothetical protein N7454_005237 [Penicillium verhagenii]